MSVPTSHATITLSVLPPGSAWVGIRVDQGNAQSYSLLLKPSDTDGMPREFPPAQVGQLPASQEGAPRTADMTHRTAQPAHHSPVRVAPDVEMPLRELARQAGWGLPSLLAEVKAQMGAGHGALSRARLRGRGGYVAMSDAEAFLAALPLESHVPATLPGTTVNGAPAPKRRQRTVRQR